MDELLKILLGFAIIAGFVRLYLKVNLFLTEIGERIFGPRFRFWRRRTSKVEVQTLFHGNTKDQDQI